MKLKTILIALAWASALGISYFAFDSLTSLGDFASAWGREPLAVILSLLSTVPPIVAVWMSIILIEQAEARKQIIKWFLLCAALPWAWLYIGTLIVGIIRLQ
jgi:hypothetical protein